MIGRQARTAVEAVLFVVAGLLLLFSWSSLNDLHVSDNSADLDYVVFRVYASLLYGGWRGQLGIS